MDNTTIYSKTARGMAELKTSTRNLSREQIKALIMVNGQLSLTEFSRNLSVAGATHFIAVVRELEQMGLVRATPAVQRNREDDFPAPGALPVIEVTELTGEASVQAWAEARRGARTLQEKGFYAHRDMAPEAGAEGGGAVVGPAAGRRVLVIEDDEEILQLLDMLLVEAGFVVSTANSVSTALAMLERASGFDLVLLDVVLPGTPGRDGFDILERIRGNERLRQLPVIMVTSQISDEHVLRGLKAGSDGYIFKPFKWEALYACIRSVTGL